MKSFLHKLGIWGLNPWILGILIGVDYWLLAWDVYNPIANKARFWLAILGLILTVVPLPSAIRYKKTLVLLATLGVMDILGKETLYQFEFEHFLLLLSSWALGGIVVWGLPDFVGKRIYRWAVGAIISTWLGYQVSWIVLMIYGFVGIGLPWLIGIVLGGFGIIFFIIRYFNQISLCGLDLSERASI